MAPVDPVESTIFYDRDEDRIKIVSSAQPDGVSVSPGRLLQIIQVFLMLRNMSLSLDFGVEYLVFELVCS